MSAEPKLYTEREAVRREWTAAAIARCSVMWAADLGKGHRSYEGGDPCDSCVESVRLRYPSPTVVRPRVLYDSESNISGAQWSVSDTGHLRFRESPKAPWLTYSEFLHTGYAAPLPNRVKLWADLLANPTEEVSDD